MKKHMLRTNETERYCVCVRIFREQLALLHEWLCREEQDQMRKIRWRRNTRSTTKVTRKGFARETGSRFSASVAGRIWRSFSQPVGRLLQIATNIIISLLYSLIVSRKWLTMSYGLRILFFLALILHTYLLFDISYLL